jgi:DNA-binding protein HU-beta
VTRTASAATDIKPWIVETGPLLILEGFMAAKKTEAKKAGALSKSALINAVVEETGDISRKQVKTVLEALADIAHKELKKSGIFTVPGFAKFRVVKKAATKARQGINPFTKQPQTFAAKAASKSVRARPIKAIKDALA